jgi:hypothetical protein
MYQRMTSRGPATGLRDRGSLSHAAIVAGFDLWVGGYENQPQILRLRFAQRRAPACVRDDTVGGRARCFYPPQQSLAD